MFTIHLNKPLLMYLRLMFRMVHTFYFSTGSPHRESKPLKVEEGTQMNANVKIPESLEELCDYIEEAAKRREKIKAVSTKYSEMWTDISGSDGIVIDTSRYDML